MKRIRVAGLAIYPAIILLLSYTLIVSYIANRLYRSSLNIPKVGRLYSQGGNVKRASCSGGKRKEAKTLFYVHFLWRREKNEKKLFSSQPSNLPCPKEDFEPYPKPFSNRWKGLNRRMAETAHSSTLLVSRDTR